MVNTKLVDNSIIRKLYVPDSEEPTDAEFEAAAQTMTPMPIPWLEPEDITEGVLYLAAESGRYVTGTELTIDAGTQLF
jgi:NAD(P)-dependent dehydrogenase (short-subunit alcohol dehydrogenase family)